MKAIWTSDEASYAGEYVKFERIWSWPKPAQRPHPPVLVGGNGPGVLDRVLAFGDAWFPNHAPEGILERAAELRSRADRPVDLMVMGVPADAKVLEATPRPGSGGRCTGCPRRRAGRSSGRSTGTRRRSRNSTGQVTGGLTAGGLTARVAKYPGMYRAVASAWCGASTRWVRTKPAASWPPICPVSVWLYSIGPSP